MEALAAALEGGGAGMNIEIVPRTCSPLQATEEENNVGAGAEDAPTVAEEKMAELMEKLNLTSEEATAVILEDENDEDLVSLEWAIIGKVLSPTILHVQTIMSALRPAWGNPNGMEFRSVGDNTFIVEFASKADKDRIKAGAPWTVGKHAVLINNFDARQRPSDVCFDKLTVWARIKNPRFELMNRSWGEELGARLGKVESVETDSQGRAWGDYLRVRVTVDITKPLLRCVTVYSKKYKELDTYEVVYERLPHYCFSCGLLGHSSMECPTPAERDAEGKLPWNADKLCVKDEKKRSFLTPKSVQSSQSSGRSSHLDDKKGDTHFSTKAKSVAPKTDGVENQDEFSYPSQLKVQNQKLKDNMEESIVCNDLFPLQDSTRSIAGQKRKQTKVYKSKVTTTNTGEMVMLNNISKAIVLGGNNLKPNDTCKALGPMVEEEHNDSFKKQKKDLTFTSLGSADRAEAVAEQPRHTP
uniref:Uncharacterized protein n=1 Tax=Avena sativa TaxID=4498 RepID=A0ACD5YIE3_AVESA